MHLRAKQTRLPDATPSNSSAYTKPPRNSWADIIFDLVPMSPYPGVKISLTPCAPVAPDACYVAQGLVEGYRRRERRVRRVVWGFLVLILIARTFGRQRARAWFDFDPGGGAVLRGLKRSLV